ncbi:MAG: hypothetical protein R3B40_14580 [Polyangiales bacterium]|nr:hypothetical protein [Myxococcales bacterium]MCB9659280.1 hypothetical protein [Sandaracinaceae bacterium]
MDQGSQVDMSAGDTGTADSGGGSTLLACQRDDLFMSGIDLANRTVRLTNPTMSDITIGGTNYQLCQGPGAYSALPEGVVPAGGSLTVAIPNGITTDPVNGTLALYNPGSFTTRDAMLDYVCWGDGAGTPRLNVAQQTGTDGTVLWDDQGCVQLAGSTDLYLRTGTPGNTAVDYRNSPSNVVCMPDGMDAGVDGGPVDGGVDAGPVIILECERDSLIIESVNMQTDEITLYNPTGTMISTNGNYQFCQGESGTNNYSAVPAVMVPPYGRVTFNAPSTIVIDNDRALALYRNSSFGSRDAMVDYMCWGTGGDLARITEARMVGTDGTALWDAGGCTPANEDETVYRVPGTEGNSAADYSTTAPVPGLSCGVVL